MIYYNRINNINKNKSLLIDSELFIETNNTCLSEKILNPKLSILLIRARNELNHELDFTSHTRVDL